MVQTQGSSVVPSLYIYLQCLLFAHSRKKIRFLSAEVKINHICITGVLFVSAMENSYKYFCLWMWSCNTSV